VNYKHRAVLSSYSDISKISSNVKIIHFRKFVSKKVLNIVIKKCPKLKIISLSRYASKRLNSNLIEILYLNQISLEISKKDIGRPNLLERFA
jgi:hypothetical protein